MHWLNFSQSHVIEHPSVLEKSVGSNISIIFGPFCASFSFTQALYIEALVSIGKLENSGLLHILGSFLNSVQLVSVSPKGSLKLLGDAFTYKYKLIPPANPMGSIIKYLPDEGA